MKNIKTTMRQLPQKLRSPKMLQLFIFVTGFAIGGVVALLQTFAQGTSSISGFAFKDMNRNSVMDAGEEPWQNHQIYLFNDSGTNTAVAYTDVNGKYSFTGLADGSYGVAYASPSLAGLQLDWTPTTTVGYRPSHSINLTGTATANFGWRPIVHSTNLDAPITQKTYPEGLIIQVYNDVVAPDVIYDILRKGNLIGAELGSTTIRMGIGAYTATGSSYGSNTNGTYINYAAINTITWQTWLVAGENALFHEHGHVWAGYFSTMVQSDPKLNEYLKIRGLTGDLRVDSSYGWSRHELIAEDYRQLFGSPDGRKGGQANGELPPAKDVPGLEDYLRNVFTKAPVTSLTAPTNLTATASPTSNGPAVQLNWTTAGGSAARYNIYRGGINIGYVNAPSTTYFDGLNLEYSKAYSYYVKAVGTDGRESAASNTIQVTTPVADTTKPSTPTGLSSPSKTNTSISLQWVASTDNVGIKEYRIYQENRQSQPILKGTTTNLNFTVTGLKSNSGYLFYVVAVDAAGNESLPSKVLNVKTKR
jgi:chitodextrinase